MSESTDAPDLLDGALRDIKPTLRDVATAVTRANVLASLFGRREPVVVGRYTIEERIGAGGGGEVFVATDPELSRKVALKLLHVAGNVERLLAEGQALARLSHPNVVPVYDTGRVGGQIYVVMELVTGATLRAYCHASERTVRDIVGAYRQAGAGLAAAHRAGFVHRDFKPDNAIVGEDGRVRVVDFGLARTGDRDDPAVAAGSAPAGTPRYMSPEQIAGDAISAATDQYAFCVSLREGLEANGPVPRWVEAILRRGTAEVPGDRFPSMEALLAALARDPASRWKRRALVAGIAVLASGTFVLGRADRDEGPSCDATAALGDAWTPERAARLAAHAGQLRSPYAPQAIEQLSTTLGDYAARLRAGNRRACIAHRDGTESTAVFDRRIACISGARAALSSAAHIAMTVSDDKLAAAVSAVGALPDLERCADAAAMASTIAPPPLALARQAAALADELAGLEIEVRAALRGARMRVDESIAKARAVGYAPLVARALFLAGRAAVDEDRSDDAIAPLGEATRIALTVGDQALAVESFALRTWALRHDPTAALAGSELIEAIADGLPESARASRAVLSNSFGVLANVEGQRERAREAFERALELSRGVTGPKALELSSIRLNLGLVVGPERALALAREHIAVVGAELGPTHPLSLVAAVMVAYLEPHRTRSVEELTRACRLFVELHPTSAFDIIACQHELAWRALEAGDDSALRHTAVRALATEAHGGSGFSLELARALLAKLDGDAKRASTLFEAVRTTLGALDTAPWWVLADAADLELWLGNYDAARVLLERVVAANPSVNMQRRLAFARMRTGIIAPALAWYRDAGGYEEVIRASKP